jgi:DNA polymerase elongation subunit (family B)
LRGIKDGKRFNEVVKFKPSLFLPVNQETKFKTLDGQNVKPLRFDSIKDAKDFIKEYSDIGNFNFYGNTKFEYSFISDHYPGQIEYDPEQVVICNIDIETGSDNGFPEPSTASEPVVSIAAQIHNHYFIFGCGEYENTRDDVTYIKANDEVTMLEKFIDWWKKAQPDVVTGWNVAFFDIPYLVNRIDRIFGKKKVKELSPWGYIRERKFQLFGKSHTSYDILGISVLDYIEMYRKYATNRPENYRLDTVAHIELNEGKLSYEEYGNLHTLYKRNYQKFIDYNIKDVELVSRLDEKLQFIQMVMAIAYDAKVNYVDVFAQVRMWDAIIHNYFRENGLVLPQNTNHEKSDAYAGAYVKEVEPGLKKWVVSFDLNSLYPNLISEFNISPECLDDMYKDVTVDRLLDENVDTDYLNEHNITLAANGHHFKLEEEGFLPKILMKMYEDRKSYKKKMIEQKKLYEKINAEIKRRGI